VEGVETVAWVLKHHLRDAGREGMAALRRRAPFPSDELSVEEHLPDALVGLL
jgi:hypothetical protein